MKVGLPVGSSKPHPIRLVWNRQAGRLTVRDSLQFCRLVNTLTDE
ncbi:MAG TPA: hypothetical protein PKN47_20215 [Nitrospira sp.]|nr:hypothetical protein [Nitrospira sp.]